jgi:hypothetical protein
MVPKAGDETHIVAGPRTGVNSGGRWRATDSGCSRGIRIRTRPPTRAMSSMTSRTSRGSAARSVAGSRRRRAPGAATVEERPRRSSSVAGPRGTRSSRAVDVPAARTSGAGRSVCGAQSGRFTRTGTKRVNGPRVRRDAVRPASGATHHDLGAASEPEPLDGARRVGRDLQVVRAAEERADFTVADLRVGRNEPRDPM